MARQINHPDITHMVYFYIDLYYSRLEKTPGLRQREADHIAEISYVDTLFKNCLKKTCNAKKFNYEENEGKFLAQIEILTQAFTRQKARIEEAKKRKELFQEFGK